MTIEITITEAGRAALINAAHTGTGPTVISEIGLSPTAVVPAPGMVALAGELKRIAGVGGEVVAADTIMISAIDDSADTYTLRSFALYLADGTLFAVYGQADPILEKAAASMAALSMNVILADIAATEITFGDVFFSNPPATTEVQGIAELATLDEARAGMDAARIVTPYTARNAVLNWLAGLDGAGSGLDADLLDGQHGAWYADIIARLGYTPLNQAQFTGAQILSRLLTVDGSGSGLDADTLDGADANAFLRITSYVNTSSYGYLTLSNGLKIQWRRGFSVPQEVTSFAVTFPLAFSVYAASFLEWRAGGAAVPIVEQVQDSATQANVVLRTAIPLYSLYTINLFAIGF